MGASSVRRFAGQLAATTAIAGILATSAQAQQTIPLPGIDVTSSRLGQGIVGASTSIITAEEIARSPSSTLQDILSREPGIQVTNLFGGVNGVGSTVDMRGFGAAAASNSLILINGRRINDLDLVGDRSRRDPARQHRAHRDHARQQRRRALRRRRGRRRDQHRDQVGRRAAAEGTVRGCIRIVQAARRQRVVQRIERAVVGKRLWPGDELRRLSGEQRLQAAQRRRRFPLHRPGGQRLSQPFRRRSGHRAARRPARRSAGSE